MLLVPLREIESLANVPVVVGQPQCVDVDLCHRIEEVVDSHGCPKLVSIFDRFDRKLSIDNYHFLKKMQLDLVLAVRFAELCGELSSGREVLESKDSSDKERKNGSVVTAKQSSQSSPSGGPVDDRCSWCSLCAMEGRNKY